MVFILQWGEADRENTIITKYNECYDKLHTAPSDKTVVQSLAKCHLLWEITSKCKRWEQTPNTSSHLDNSSPMLKHMWFTWELVKTWLVGLGWSIRYYTSENFHVFGIVSYQDIYFYFYFFANQLPVKLSSPLNPMSCVFTFSVSILSGAGIHKHI